MNLTRIFRLSIVNVKLLIILDIAGSVTRYDRIEGRKLVCTHHIYGVV